MTDRKIPAAVVQAVWASSGGYCQNPNCNTRLLRFFVDGSLIHIRELAHIIGASDSGPRSDQTQHGLDKNAYDNLIVLCPSCHTEIDKTPRMFPPELLRGWKRDHESRINNCFIAPRYSSRDELVREARRIMRTNKIIFDTYGPTPERVNSFDSDTPQTWRRAVVQTVLPNNQRVIELLKVNRDLLSQRDQDACALFEVHSSAFSFNHLGGDKIPRPPQFPDEFEKILDSVTDE